MGNKHPTDEVRIGARLRAEREARKLTLKQLGEMTGFSVAYLSQVERDITAPSLAALSRIGNALGKSMVDLLGGSDHCGSDEEILVRRDERRVVLYPGSSVRHYQLTPDFNRNIQFVWIEGAAGATSGGLLSHEGEECGLVLKGRLELWVGTRHYMLEEGDSVSFKSTEPHRWRVPESSSLQAVWAISPPSLR